MKRQVGVMPGSEYACSPQQYKLPPVQWEAATGILETSAILYQVVKSQVLFPEVLHADTLGSSVSCSSTSPGSSELSVYYAMDTVLAASPWTPNLSCPQGLLAHPQQSIFLFSLPCFRTGRRQGEP